MRLLFPGINSLTIRDKFLLLFSSFFFFNLSPLFAQRQHLLFENSFEGAAAGDAYLTGTIGGTMENNQHCCTYSIQKATNAGSFTVRAGTGAVRYELHSTDPPVSQSIRAELEMPNGYTDVGERWYGFSYYFENWLSDSRVSHELQFHPDNGTGAAVLQLRTTNNQYEIVHGTLATSYQHDLFPVAYRTVVPNVWADFVFHVKWAADNTGFLQVWKDGVLVVNESNIITSEPEGQYAKIGINHFTWSEGNIGTVTERIFYIDEIRVGDALATYCDVAPDRPNDKATGATLLTLGSGCTGALYSNSCSIRNTGENNLKTCSGIIEAPVWFKFTAPASGAVRISTDVGSGNTFTDSKLALYAATNVNDYATFSVIACDDDGGSTLGTGLMSVVYATGLISGTTYYIAVDKHNSSVTNGTFCITVDELSSSMLATSSSCASTFQTPVANANTTYMGWIPLLNAGSKLIALVRNPSGGAVDAYSVAQNISTINRTDATSGQKYLRRNFSITNAGAVSNADVQFFFLNTELTSLQGVDAAVTLANLGVTRQTGAICQPDFVTANGTNSLLAQSGNGSVNGVSWITTNTPGFSNFYLHTSRAPVTVKTFLQGAYNAGLTRHKDVSAAWATILNANALNQPYTSFGHTGTESVSPGFFVSTVASTDVLDWVLLELRSAAPPAVPVATRAAFIREDGAIVDLDGVSSVAFRGVPNGSYYVSIRHRNHLGIRTSVIQVLDGALGGNPAPAVYDFSSLLTQAYKDVTIPTNEAMALNGSTYLMWAGNANQDSYVRVTTQAIPPISSDAAYILGTILGGNPNLTVSGYSIGDINMDGSARATTQAIPPIPSDVSFILSTPLGGTNNATRREHK